MRWPIAVRFTLTAVLLGALYGAGDYGWLLAIAVVVALAEALTAWMLENERDTKRQALAVLDRQLEVAGFLRGERRQGVIVSHSQR